MNKSRRTLILTCALGVIIVSNLSAVITIDTVPVGNLGNTADPLTGYGSVGYDYGIGKYEVTLDQYTAFLNAVGATDTYGLYDTQMASMQPVAGIARSGAAGSYTYSVIGGGNRPATFINWFRAARFVNWLENGQPTGLQTAATTEDGAYTLNGTLSGVSVSRNSGAMYGLPSRNEWYKAAYHQPAAQGGDSDDYWFYATRANTIPNSRNGSITDPNSANFVRDDSLPNGFNGGYAVPNSPVFFFTGQNYLTDVGAFTLAGSYYGTFDQGGSVREWNDEVVAGSSRGLCGGSWNSYEIPLQSSALCIFPPVYGEWDYGFRIVTLPKPTVSVTLTDAVVVINWTGNVLQNITNKFPVSTNPIVWQTITNAAKPHIIPATNSFQWFRSVSIR